MEETKKKWHVTVTDNETNEIVKDLDTNGIFMSLMTDDGATGTNAFNGVGMSLVQFAEHILSALDDAKAQNPMEWELAKVFHSMKDIREATAHDTGNADE